MVNNDLSLPVPVIVVEDEPLIQQRLNDILLAIGYQAENLYFAQDLSQANKLLEKYSASFALVDLGLPDGNGIEFIESLKKYDPTITILVISAWSTEDAILNALSAGATGYVLKERDDLEVSLSIKSVLRGGAPIDPFIAQKILKQLQLNEKITPNKPSNEQKTNDIEAVLSKREMGILELVSQGLSNKEIADQLSLSRYTVESHIKHIYRKLAVCNRAKAIDTARHLGLLD
ncbi:DNA-binding response regulator [Acinetobacter wuhouensis]|uniref:DNA-binding response regulator n=1 Tax=Acinetobacter wuhouensis TaxID=1879050 RepID=A0A385C4C9_9GAMM|nr:response regulator transcription factor [Acinetobacter wuhouensis]AXQ22106.1 DNA-binding response regulator [Acinetobacter wuhouensis]AYO54677.1 DNA-binding response regulator [Acinetobacter wuhouensis]RZG46166.1 response regulator transcription factor [Acinetobacter wuhouensis]RZG71259.1 response regulator transcription factor [Acinetobacter wuhouensis]